VNIITEIQVTPLSFPLAKPFSNHVRKITHIKGLEIRILTNVDIVGHGFIYGLSDMPHKEIINILESRILSKLFSENHVIDDATELMAIWQKIWPALKAEQHSQSELTALAIVDIAIWDIFIKSKKTSLHKYLGGAQNKISAYGTTGWLSLSLDDLISECKEYESKGVNAFKIRLGHKEDILRVKTVRKIMGDQFTLMLDANQRYTVEEGIQIAKDLAPFNMLWLEEPTVNNLEEIAKIKKGSILPIALGENIIDEKDFIFICQNKLTDILQPDLPRCGGITGFIRVSDIALKYNIPVCNHLLYEISLSLVAAYKNGYMIEYDNLLPAKIFTHDFQVKNGFMKPPEFFGTGVELTDAALKKYALSSHTIHPSPFVRCKL